MDDLVEFVYSGAGCRLLLMGDTAQLPPVGEEQSPALVTEALKGYGLNVIEVDLTQVVRQVQASGILWNATQIRRLIAEEECYSLPKIKVSGFPDIKVVPGDELIETLTGCYEKMAWTRRLWYVVPISGPIYIIKVYVPRFFTGKMN